MDHKKHQPCHSDKDAHAGKVFHKDASENMAQDSDEQNIIDSNKSKTNDVKIPVEMNLVKDLQDQLAEERDLHMRALAALDNLKKRVQKERDEMRLSVTSGIVEDLLPILDHFELGLQSAAQAGAESVLSGFKMIFEQFKSILGTHGLAEIDPVDQPFNPHEHDCMRREYSESHPENVVLLVMRKGYKIRDRLIRPAAVVVSTKQQA